MSGIIDNNYNNGTLIFKCYNETGSLDSSDGVGGADADGVNNEMISDAHIITPNGSIYDNTNNTSTNIDNNNNSSTYANNYTSSVSANSVLVTKASGRGASFGQDGIASIKNWCTSSYSNFVNGSAAASATATTHTGVNNGTSSIMNSTSIRINNIANGILINGGGGGMADSNATSSSSYLSYGNSSSSSSTFGFYRNDTMDYGGGQLLVRFDDQQQLLAGGGVGSGDHQQQPPYDFCMNRVDNVSYMNISCEIVLEYAIPLYGYCIPFLLFVTMAANLLIVIVLSRRTMATPTNSVLMGEFKLCIYYVGNDTVAWPSVLTAFGRSALLTETCPVGNMMKCERSYVILNFEYYFLPL